MDAGEWRQRKAGQIALIQQDGARRATGQEVLWVDIVCRVRRAGKQDMDKFLFMLPGWLQTGMVAQQDKHKNLCIAPRRVGKHPVSSGRLGRTADMLQLGAWCTQVRS